MQPSSPKVTGSIQYNSRCSKQVNKSVFHVQLFIFQAVKAIGHIYILCNNVQSTPDVFLLGIGTSTWYNTKYWYWMVQNISLKVLYHIIEIFFIYQINLLATGTSPYEGSLQLAKTFGAERAKFNKNNSLVRR